jgi:hypothetical protein
MRDFKTDYTNGLAYTTLHVPESSDWKCEMFGMGAGGLIWHPRKGQEPMWFWRMMQYLCFGNKWINTKKVDAPTTAYDLNLYNTL